MKPPWQKQTPKEPKEKPKVANHDEERFGWLCEAGGLPRPQQKFRFSQKRKWEFDWCWPEVLLAVEIEGGAWVGGRHTTGSGFSNDLEKYLEAQLMGWTIMRVDTEMVKTGRAVDAVRRWMEISKG
jgi:hypothetical protein